MRVRHRWPWCWHRRAFYLSSEPTGAIHCQDTHNLKVRSLDTLNRYRHAARDDLGRYTLGNLQSMLLDPVYNT
jgi:hypothetical protein